MVTQSGTWSPFVAELQKNTDEYKIGGGEEYPKKVHKGGTKLEVFNSCITIDTCQNSSS